MSKVDALRAMREARYAQTTKPTGARPSSSSVQQGLDPAAATGVPAARCGHTSISGKVCTRPVNHPEKNHRYI